MPTPYLCLPCRTMLEVYLARIAAILRRRETATRLCGV